jgi:hypothetical protein
MLDWHLRLISTKNPLMLLWSSNHCLRKLSQNLIGPPDPEPQAKPQQEALGIG